jgi:AcrR family transcriptional regulator
MVVRTPATGEETGGPRLARRRAILDAATELVADRGFGGVSVQEIADAAGAHKTTVLYHFATKEALHEAVLDEALGRIAEDAPVLAAGFAAARRVHARSIHAFFAEQHRAARIRTRAVGVVRPGGVLRALSSRFTAGGRGARAGDGGRSSRPSTRRCSSTTCTCSLSATSSSSADRAPRRATRSIEALIARRDHLVNQISASARRRAVGPVSHPYARPATGGPPRP